MEVEDGHSSQELSDCKCYLVNLSYPGVQICCYLQIYMYSCICVYGDVLCDVSIGKIISTQVVQYLPKMKAMTKVKAGNTFVNAYANVVVLFFIPRTYIILPSNAL